jgi:hypothetical protein
MDQQLYPRAARRTALVMPSESPEPWVKIERAAQHTGLSVRWLYAEGDRAGRSCRALAALQAERARRLDAEPVDGRRGVIAAERETTITTSDADDTVLVWSAQRRHITRMRQHPRFEEVATGIVDGAEWASFRIAANAWSPVTGAKRADRTVSQAQREALAHANAHRASSAAAASDAMTVANGDEHSDEREVEPMPITFTTRPVRPGLTARAASPEGDSGRWTEE